MTDLDLIKQDLALKGVTHYQIHMGADGCHEVDYGRVVCYYVIREGKIVDVIVD